MCRFPLRYVIPLLWRSLKPFFPTHLIFVGALPPALFASPRLPRPTELTRFPALRERLSEVVSGLLKRSVGPTQSMVSNLVKVELAYINTSHPDFIGGSRAVARLMDRIGKEGQQQRERRRKGGTTSANVSIPESGGDGDGEAQSISGSRHGGGRRWGRGRRDTPLLVLPRKLRRGQ